jgi:hypothetical protein
MAGVFAALDAIPSENEPANMQPSVCEYFFAAYGLK